MAEQIRQSDRVAALANRLRLVQTDFADQTDEARRDYLIEEVKRALGAIPQVQHKAFLDELQAHFPTWDGKVEVKPDTTTQRSSFDEKELKDPSFLVTRLIEVCAALPEAQRRVITDRLKDAGLTAVGIQDWPAAPLSEARTKLQLGPKESIASGRALELLGQFTEFVYSLDQVSWKTWRAIAPQSTLRRPAALQGTVARFASGDANVGKDQLVSELKILRQLVAALVGTLSQTGRIAVQHYRSISPDEITVLVGPKISLLREAAYWRKYVELYGAMDSGGVEDAIRTALAAYAESLIQGAWSTKQ